MKSIIQNAILITMSATLLGCAKNPESVAAAYLKAMDEGNVSEANEYSSMDKRTVNSSWNAQLPWKKFMELPAGPNEFKLSDHEIDGDKAQCSFICKGNGAKRIVYLRKIDGKWLVVIGPWGGA